jgi:hypothetical protein
MFIFVAQFCQINGATTSTKDFFEIKILKFKNIYIINVLQ